MNSPPFWPETQCARGTYRGRQQTNLNYVRILNPISKRAINLKLARKWVAELRAEWVTDGAEIRLIESHPANSICATGAKEKLAATAAGYDGIKSGFQWRGGQSGNATVMMTQRGPSS